MNIEQSVKFPGVSDLGAIRAIVNGHGWLKSQHFLSYLILFKINVHVGTDSVLLTMQQGMIIFMGIF